MSFVPWSKSQFHFTLKVCNNLFVPEKTQYRQWRSYVLVGVLFVCIVILFSVIVPYNDDEFIQFIPLICGLFPGNAVSNCSLFDLRLAGTSLVLPLRSYHYCGSIEALLFFPLHVLWSSPIAVRLFRMAFFLAGGILLVKKFQLNFRYAILGLCLLFPYFFVHIADTAGGNVIQLFSIYLLMYLIDQWTRTLRWAPAIMTALVVFLGFWAKLSYVWYAPGIAILFFMSAYQYRKILSGSRIFRWQILGVIVLLASLIAILLLSESPTVPGTYPYIEALMHSERFATQPAFMEYYGYKGAIHAFFHPFDATQRIYHSYDATVLSWIYSIIMYFTLPAVLALLAWCWRKQKYVHSLAQPIIFYVAFVITIFFITSISKTGGMHHSILAYPFLILSFLSTWKVLVHHHHVLPKYLPHFLRIYVVGYVCINLLFFLIFPLQPLRAYSDPTRFLIHAITQKDDIAERYLVYLPDWGTYFYTSLFGSRKQSVVFGFFYRGDTSIAGLQKLAHQQGRKLMIVFSPLQSSPHRFLSSDLTLQSCSAIPSHAAWQILAESDPELTKMCQKYAWVTDGGKNLTRNVFVRMWLAF